MRRDEKRRKVDEGETERSSQTITSAKRRETTVERGKKRSEARRRERVFLRVGPNRDGPTKNRTGGSEMEKTRKMDRAQKEGGEKR